MSEKDSNPIIQCSNEDYGPDYATNSEQKTAIFVFFLITQFQIPNSLCFNLDTERMFVLSLIAQKIELFYATSDFTGQVAAPFKVSQTVLHDWRNGNDDGPQTQ